jgi:diaminohydroxyphosphoribosylaminopyrimidine deaminase / 5-amino-6-(5-phosphoribosylamino)uracil reductase
MPSSPNSDLHFMAHALELARASEGLASPNPQVGCVIVRDGVVLGQGAHVYDLYDHAEIVALKAAGGHVAGATAYVTLEPCSHHGRTGPCADALIAAGIARCVVATVDPNPAVSGRGLAKLRAAGVEVEVGLMEPEARVINNAFGFSITHNRPFVTLKAALSVDGMLAPAAEIRIAGEPFWLTSAAAREEVQRMRHGADAIVTGIGTVLADDPLLTDRTGRPRRRPLMRVVLDSALRIPLRSKLVQSAADDLWIMHSPDVASERVAGLTERGVRLTAVPGASNLASEMWDPMPRMDLVVVLEHLHAAQIRSVLLEAGSSLNGAFLGADLVDEVALFYSETELGPGAVPFAAGAESPFALEQRLIGVEKQTVGPDVRVSGLLHNSWPKSVEIV